jgi:hypothetical protein
VTVHVLVLADSLAFHGPDQAHPPTDPRLYPQVMAAALSESLGEDVQADLVARLGWTARDAWWSLTKDPNTWGVLMPRAVQPRRATRSACTSSPSDSPSAAAITCG